MNKEKELFRKTEGMLYRYYKSIGVINTLKIEIEQLKRHKEAIREDIKETNVSIVADLNMGVSYGEKVQTSATGMSYAEKEMLAQIEKLEKNLVYVTRKILKKKAKLREIETNNISIKNNIESLGEEEKRLLEWKYSEKKSLDWIAVEMFQGARATAYRKREELVNNIANWNKLAV